MSVHEIRVPCEGDAGWTPEMVAQVTRRCKLERIDEIHTDRQGAVIAGRVIFQDPAAVEYLREHHLTFSDLQARLRKGRL